MSLHLISAPSEQPWLFLNSYPESEHLLSILLLGKSPDFHASSVKGGGVAFLSSLQAPLGRERWPFIQRKQNNEALDPGSHSSLPDQSANKHNIK